MHTHPRRPHRARHPFRLIALAIALALAWTSSASAQDAQPHSPPPSRLGTDGEGVRGTPGTTLHHRPGSGSNDLQATVMRGMQKMQSSRPTGNVDHDFAALMRDHHLTGIEMARIQLQHGKDPALRQKAHQLIEQQSREVEAFERWLQAHPRPAAPGERPSTR